MASPLALPAWQSLHRQFSARAPAGPHPLSALPTLTALDWHVDFSRQAIDAPTWSLLLQLADQAGLAEKRAQLLAGAALNTTEARPVLHTVLRAPANAAPAHPLAAAIRRELDRVAQFSDEVRRGKRRSVTDQKFTDVVNIGIGGSLLGPALVVTALARFAAGPRLHFLSNVDGAHATDILRHLNPATTLFVVTSKTFTTDETNTNARTAEAWLTAALGAEAKGQHFVAVTANAAEAGRQGYQAAQIFGFWDGVGGRFSLWSAVGMAVALATGFTTFQALLDGAHAMDKHFAEAPFADNIPVVLALVGIWQRNFQGIHGHAVLPYAQRLALLPAHLQQLEMESNGKSVDLDGRHIDYPTCPILFGAAGTNGQHSFHQLLHQGTDLVSADIICLAERESPHQMHHDKLNAHALAQADAFWYGKSLAANLADLAHLAEPARHAMAAHRTHPGGRPVTVLALPRLDAHNLGSLIALYEHKVFVQGVIWNINSFDQWGVELGKSIATALLPVLGKNAGAAPAHLRSLIDYLRHPPS